MMHRYHFSTHPNDPEQQKLSGYGNLLLDPGAAEPSYLRRYGFHI